ncbi:MAG TPA: DUF5996 family protein, partial [Actinomycetota bacterium]|nr:DUF5996 family protein [Actinomycetota bacterium]
YEQVLEAFGHIGVTIEINPKPQEVPEPIAFPDDDRAAYHPAWVARFHTVLTSVERVTQRFRAPFRGRHSRLQFYWGTFDLNYARFSGRPASAPPGAGVISIPAMDAELYTCGFWPGDDRRTEPSFFAYAFPPPEGLERAPAEPGFWDQSIGEFILPYEAVRLADDPDEHLLAFLEAGFRAAADLGSWPEELRG